MLNLGESESEQKCNSRRGERNCVDSPDPFSFWGTEADLNAGLYHQVSAMQAG